METYQNLIVWQKSITFVESIYAITRLFPDEEKFGLISQIRRSAVSIPSNIAEGHGRKSNAELIRFLKISFGSSSELETQLIISMRLGFLEESKFMEMQSDLIEIRRMLNKFISNLSAKN